MIKAALVIVSFVMVVACEKRTELVQQIGLNEDPPDEILVFIDAKGLVYLNNKPMDDAPSVSLDDLSRYLIQLKRAADAAGTRLIVTIHTDKNLEHQRVVDVTDAIQQAKISAVTFQTEAGE